MMRNTEKTTNALIWVRAKRALKYSIMIVIFGFVSINILKFYIMFGSVIFDDSYFSQKTIKEWEQHFSACPAPPESMIVWSKSYYGEIDMGNFEADGLAFFLILKTGQTKEELEEFYLPYIEKSNEITRKKGSGTKAHYYYDIISEGDISLFKDKELVEELRELEKAGETDIIVVEMNNMQAKKPFWD